MLFNERKINWKKGLFRLWIIFSLMWMILVFSFGNLFGHIRDFAHAYSSYKEAKTKTSSINMGPENKPPSDLISPSNSSGPPSDLISPSGFAPDSKASSGYEDLIPAKTKTSKNVFDQFDAPKQQEFSPDEWLLNQSRDGLIRILLAGFIPPIFGLILWFAFVWVIRGFKSTDLSN